VKKRISGEKARSAQRAEFVERLSLKRFVEMEKFASRALVNPRKFAGLVIDPAG